MSRIFTDDDADLSVLDDLTVAVIGYGNQGRPQTLNMIDSGVRRVVVGNRDDGYRARAAADGHEVVEIAEAVGRADIVSILIPDEVHPEVFRDVIVPNLRPGQTVIFGHGYSVFYGLVDLPSSVDVVLVAPRMVGDLVRSRFLEGSGCSVLTAVERDATGMAWKRLLAYTKAIGGTRGGAQETTFEEETVIDLFAEQAFGALLISSILACYEVLEEAGYDPDLIYTELAGSGEMAQVVGLMSRLGVTRQLWHHSMVSNYGQISRAIRLGRQGVYAPLRATLDEIRDGTFAREWASEGIAGYAGMHRLHQEIRRSGWFAIEDRYVEGVARADGHEG
jgi:ketol-acid reductoisomerase